MSIFKVKQWWSNEKSPGESNIGEQSNKSFKVDKFNSHSDSDCLMVGEANLLKIYKPNRDDNASQTLVETDLNATILQLETGKFMVGTADRQILVLHPQSYAIYNLHRKEGHTDAGEQNILEPVVKHAFSRRAYSVTCGPFGNIKTRDFICIQALDGSLSFFDQNTFLFMYLINDVIIPGPISYIANTDSFVICKSTWVLEIHSYQQLREYSELSSRQNKKNIPQWVYNPGEEISSIQVIQTCSNISSVLALGERHLYCFQDNGLMKYMIQFDFMPICFSAYLIGWYYEPTARLLVMVVSDDAKLYVYEGTALLWSCDLLYQAIAISRCFLKYLPGGLATLSTNGIVCVSYLGTEPDLNANVPTMINDTVDPEKVQTELEAVEEALEKILAGSDDAEGQYPPVEEIIKIKADVGKPHQNLYEQFTKDTDEALHLLMCPVVVMITCEDPGMVHSVQITYDCCPPFACSDFIVCLDTINGTEIIENQVFVATESDISNTKVKIYFTITDSSGKINVLSKEVVLPLSLYCLPTQVVDGNEFKFIVETNQPSVELTEIFTDFTKEELLKNGGLHEIAFILRATKKSVNVKVIENRYSFEADDVADVTSILQHFIIRLSEHMVRINKKDFRIELGLDEELIKFITHKFLKCIETHAKERTKLNTLEEELSVLQRQFTVIQKKLLIQYGSLPPGDCDPLEFMMKDTHQRLIKCVNDIIGCRIATNRAGNSLAAVGQLLVFIFRQTISDSFKVKLVEEMLTLGTLYEDYQDWEEAVTQALSYTLNNIFQKSEKDKERLATVTEQGILSHTNLKRFFKQIRIVLELLFSEGRGAKEMENRVARIEEIVEVI